MIIDLLKNHNVDYEYINHLHKCFPVLKAKSIDIQFEIRVYSLQIHWHF